MIYTGKPTKASIYVNTAKKTIAQVKAETGCDAIINGGLFDGSFKPVCHLKVNGTVLAKDQYKYWGYGWNDNNLKLVSDYSQYGNYIACVCMVRGGVIEPLVYNSDLGGARQRTAIGLYPDGRLWLYCDKTGKTPERLQQIALNEGLESALMLDGGGSTQGIFPNGTVTASRIVHNFICIWFGADTPDKEDKKVKVCLDPGHGKLESYNQSPDGTYKEYEFSLDLAKRIRPLLQKHGVDVLLTREDDSTPALTARAELANNAKADLYVSLHSNSQKDPVWGTPSGLCVYTYASGATAQRNIAAQLLITQMEKAGVKLFGTKLYHANFTVLANTNMPAYLIEYGFHTNKDDVALLKTSAYRDKLATATAKAICEYFNIKWIEDKPVQDLTSNVIYRLQFGAFTNKAYAEALQAQLLAEGRQTIIKEDYI